MNRNSFDHGIALNPAELSSGLSSKAVATGFLLIPLIPIVTSLFLPLLGFLDEIVFVCALFILLFTALGRKSVLVSLLLIVSIGAWFVATSLLSGSNTSMGDIFGQAFLQSKFFIFCLFASTLVPSQLARAGFKFLILASLLGMVINYLYPGFFYDDLGVRERYRYEFLDTARLGGFQLNPNRLGHLFALVSFMNKDILKISGRNFRILLFVSGIAVVLSGGRVSLAMYSIGLACMFLQAVGRWELKFIAIVFITAPLFFYIASYGLEQLGFLEVASNDLRDTSFRMILVSEGFRLAVENFPFGTGLATYGTPFAMDAGVYEQTRVGDVFLFYQSTALFDSNFSSILGETGFIGLTLIFILLWRIIFVPIADKSWVAKSGIFCFLILSLFFESLLNNSICGAAFALYFAMVVDDSRKTGYWRQLHE